MKFDSSVLFKVKIKKLHSKDSKTHEDRHPVKALLLNKMMTNFKLVETVLETTKVQKHEDSSPSINDTKKS